MKRPTIKVDWAAIREIIEDAMGSDDGADAMADELERQGLKAEVFDSDGDELPESEIDTSKEDEFYKQLEERLTLAFGKTKKKERKKS